MIHLGLMLLFVGFQGTVDTDELIGLGSETMF